jgi:hypothetical protein
MVDPSQNLKYIDVIQFLSKWIPDLYKDCIPKFTLLKNRDFIYQRYLNEMIFGPRTYWKDNPIKHYNDFGNKFDTIQISRKFWRNFHRFL